MAKKSRNSRTPKRHAESQLRFPESLNEANVELCTARAIVDLVYEASSLCSDTEPTLMEIEARTLSGAMHDVLERIDRAKDLINGVEVIRG